MFDKEMLKKGFSASSCVGEVTETLPASPSLGGAVTKTPFELNSPCKPQITGTEVLDNLMRGEKDIKSEISSDSLCTSESSKSDKSCGSTPLTQVIKKPRLVRMRFSSEKNTLPNAPPKKKA